MCRTGRCRVLVCGSWLFLAGILIMSTTNLDLDQFFNSRPLLTHALSLFVMLFFAAIDGFAQGFAPYLTVLYCLPLLFALCFGKRV